MDRYAVSITTEHRILGAAEDEEELESNIVITDRDAAVTMSLPVALIIALATFLTESEELEEIQEAESEPVPAPKRMAVRRSPVEEP